MKNTSFMGFLMPVILAAFVCGCTATSKDTATQEEERPELPVVTLKTVDTVLKSAYVADVQAVKNVEIRTRVKGFLEKIYVDEGQPVKKGQLLFKINDEEYRVMLSKAKAALSNAQAAVRATELENARIKMLVDKKVISKSELDVAAAKLTADLATVDEARSTVQSAENHMAYTSLRAPFDGIIDRIPLKAGSLLEEGALLTDISDISSMFAYFSFPENEYLKYERNKNTGTADRNVTLSLSDGSSYKHAGKIEIIEAQIEQSTGSIDLRARFPNPEKLLRHGATAKLYITSAADSVILVPQQSVFDIQDKSYVYLVDNNNTLHIKSIVPITRLAHNYVVKGSLQPGDRILYEGTQGVRDGQTIKPVVKAKAALVALAK
ncbi:efflux RND transporter periplasmic adaptor subunit [Mucilaginibacter myungsuensis]|nr:efflux RND transporter periplasmic adaptor subunit [Mucilaginibacter myungsuensis]MDN3599622.1 efflux RND transporter periplasmic adaptor subunit [Mucilaginibacter myungsuensis]